MARTKRRRATPSDPAEIARRAYEARRNPALWGVNSDALNLPQNADVHTTQPETRTKTKRIERFDVFSTIKLSDHQFNAVRRYQADLAESYGVGDRDIYAPAPGGDFGSRELTSARAMAAADRTFALYDLLTPGDARLLYALSFPTSVQGSQLNWKAVVKSQTGLIDRDAASSCVKSLAENVRLAYAEIDGMQRRAA